MCRINWRLLLVLALTPFAPLKLAALPSGAGQEATTAQETTDSQEPAKSEEETRSGDRSPEETPEETTKQEEGGEAARDKEAEPDKKTESPLFDEVTLKDGSVILGEIADMTSGTLSIKAAFGADGVVKIKWDQVARIETGHDHKFQFADGSLLKGKILLEDGKTMVLVSGLLRGPLDLEKVSAINPTEKKDVDVTGVINFGSSVADGNTQTKTASFNTEVVARTERQRITLKGAWNYAENESSITARNTKGSIKYDFFLNKRFFLFASALFEEDKFQDLNLRTALSGGPGYQFIMQGDYSEWWLEGLELYTEAGLAFFNEDRRVGVDDRYIAARWAIKLDWPFSDKITLFHNHEGFPGLERIDDLYISTEQGIRLTIWEGFVSTLQVNWRWDNTPSPGFERSDALYLVTLGYQF